MNISGLKSHNYELFLDGVSDGAIPYSSVDGVLEVGPNQPNEFVTSFVGGPHLPENNPLPKNLAGTSFGASGYYSKPFLSLGQRFNNSVYSNVGPYAKLVRYKKQFTSTCINGECGKEQDGTSKEIYGRVGKILSGYRANEWGFFIQDWYNHDDGNYDAAFWSERYNMDPPIPDKKTWWDQCAKATINVYLFNDPLRELCQVEVALSNISSDDDQYFPGEDVRSLNDGSLDILTVLTGLVTGLGVWI